MFPRCLCIAVRFTGKPVLNAAWPGTLTVHGTVLSAPDTSPWLRGTQDILYINTCKIPGLLTMQYTVHPNPSRNGYYNTSGQKHTLTLKFALDETTLEFTATATIRSDSYEKNRKSGWHTSTERYMYIMLRWNLLWIYTWMSGTWLNHPCLNITFKIWTLLRGNTDQIEGFLIEDICSWLRFNVQGRQHLYCKLFIFARKLVFCCFFNQSWKYNLP